MNDDVLVVQLGEGSVEYNFDEISKALTSLNNLANASTGEIVMPETTNVGEMKNKMVEIFNSYNKINSAFHDMVVATASSLSKFESSMSEIELFGK